MSFDIATHADLPVPAIVPPEARQGLQFASRGCARRHCRLAFLRSRARHLARVIHGGDRCRFCCGELASIAKARFAESERDVSLRDISAHR